MCMGCCILKLMIKANNCKDLISEEEKILEDIQKYELKEKIRRDGIMKSLNR